MSDTGEHQDEPIQHVAAGRSQCEPSHRIPPAPSELSHLKASDTLGILHLAPALLLTAVGVALSVRTEWTVWLGGQLVLSLAFLQWFAVLHESGHGTLFRNRWINQIVGRVAGMMALIPFSSWRVVHGWHHRWTGWQDIDVTTSSLVPRRLARWERLTINVCWACWIPLFSLIYRVENYWRLRRVLALVRLKSARKFVLLDAAVLVTAYASILVWAGPMQVLQLFALALLLTLIMQDLLILSQHTHIPMQLGAETDARPVPALKQEIYTRSLRFPGWFARWFLLNLDAHELHHMYPNVPGYHLDQIAYQPQNEIAWWKWIWKARAVRADVLMFQNRDQTGFDL